jgi:hypothetical protein
MIPRVLGECSLSGGSSSETPLSGPPLDFLLLVWVLRWWFGSSGGFQLFFNWVADFQVGQKGQVLYPFWMVWVGSDWT